MAFRLKKGRAPTDELQRIARKELCRAADEVKEARQRGEAVHEARKRVKKIRAVVHLLHASLGRYYRHDDRALRSVAHQLSARRDADAAVEMVQAMQEPRCVSLVRR